MIRNMLIAASKMLDSNTKEHGTKFRARVACAKVIVDEIIASLSPAENGTDIPDFTDVMLQVNAPKQPKKPVESHPKGKIILDDNRRILSFEGLPLDAMVELDGITMTHQQAIGKQFQSGRVL